MYTEWKDLLDNWSVESVADADGEKVGEVVSIVLWEIAMEPDLLELDVPEVFHFLNHCFGDISRNSSDKISAAGNVWWLE